MNPVNEAAERKAQGREIIESLTKLYRSKQPGGGVHGQVIGMEPYVIRTNGDGLQCLGDAMDLIDALLDPFDRRATLTPARLEAAAATPAPDLWALIDAYADQRDEYAHSTERHLAKTQRENVEHAKAELASALTSNGAPCAWRVRVALDGEPCRATLQDDEPDAAETDTLIAAGYQVEITPLVAGTVPPKARHPSLGKSLLRPAISTASELPPGCYCPPDKCQAPNIMGRQTPCRREFVSAQDAPIAEKVALEVPELGSSSAALDRQVSVWRKEVARLQDLISTATGAPEVQASHGAVGDAKRLIAYAALVKAKEGQIAHLQAELAKHSEAVSTLASERAANAQLTAEIEALRAPTIADAERIAHLEGEEEISEAVIAMMSRLLASIAITLKGEEEALKRHSYHDLAELVKVMALELDIYRTVYGTTLPKDWDGRTPAPVREGVDPTLDTPASHVPRFNESEFAAMVQKGTAAWKYVPADWLEKLRGADSAADARDAARVNWMIANPSWSIRWRFNGKKKIEEWQMVDDGDSWGQWGGYRAVLDKAIAAIQAKEE